MEVSVKAGSQRAAGRIEAVVCDPDGTPAKFSTSSGEPVVLAPGGSTTAYLFIRYGQESTPLRVRLIDDEGRDLAARTFLPSHESRDNAIPVGLPATDKLVATFGMREGLADIVDEQTAQSGIAAARAVRLDSVEELPREWYGYEAVDAIVLGCSRPELYRDLADDPRRIAALKRWIELGGQAVIFCGASAADMIGPGAPLEDLAPGRFTGRFGQLREFRELENFTNAVTRITPSRVRVNAPLLEDVTGRILAHAGPQPSDLPLVIRSRRGLGEVTFVAVDPEASPLDDWSERRSLLRRSLDWPAPSPEADLPATSYAGQMRVDMINQLRAALDQQFRGVSTAPFALVTGLVLLYAAAVGPGDYFLLRRALRRMELTWMTFPLMVVATTAGAWWLAYRMKGNEIRVNQVEIVDVDVDAGQARGAVWTHFFNPRVRRYDLTLEPRFAGRPLRESGAPENDVETLASWLGVPGYGLGAMQGQRGDASLFDAGYEFDDALSAIHGMPVEQWSTKSLVGRWSGHVGAAVDADLTIRADGLLAGRVQNRTGVRLEECVLIHRAWAFPLSALAPGAETTIDGGPQPRSLKTLLTSVPAGEDPNVRTSEDGSVLFDYRVTDVARIVKTMMFYDAIGGLAYAKTPHRYQSFIDMSRLIRGDQAVLLARSPADAGSTWIVGASTRLSEKSPARPLASAADRRWIYYRFIIPLRQREEGRDVDQESSEAQQGSPVYGPSADPRQGFE